MKKHRHYYGRKPNYHQCQCGKYKKGFEGLVRRATPKDMKGIEPLRDLLGGFFSPRKK